MRATTPTPSPRTQGLSILWWLALAFAGVALAGILITVFLVRRNVNQALDTWQSQRTMETLMGPLVTYYQQHGSWEGLETWLQQGAPGAERRQLQALARTPWVLTDPQGRPILGTWRKPLPRQWVRERIPIEVDGQVVGWFWSPPTRLERAIGAAERLFMEQVQQAAWRSAALALLLALLGGFLMAYAFARPVRRLTQALTRVARGHLGLQVEPPDWSAELSQLTEAFNHMSAALARAEYLRKQMTADLAHDLRTPISVIMGYAEALKEGLIEPDEEVFETLYRETHYLQRLVDDLRLLSLHDAGRLSLNRQRVDVRDLLRQVVQGFEPQARARAITLRLEVPSEPLPAFLDPDRIRRVLDNLMSNALRHTPEKGRITLKAQRDDGFVVLEVADTGEGIPPEHLPYVFERFYRVDKARTRDGRSSGLGLAIVKALVEAHGGRVAVESQVGRGTRFRLWLPQDGRD